MKLKFIRYALLSLSILIALLLLVYFNVEEIQTKQKLLVSGLWLSVIAMTLSIYYWHVTSNILKEIAKQALRSQKAHKTDIQTKELNRLSESPLELQEMIHHLRKDLKSLNQEREQLQTIIQGMIEGLLVTDTSQKILLANPAFYHMFQIEKPCEGQTVLETIRHHKIHESLKVALQKQIPQENEVSFPTAKNEKHFLFHINPWKDTKKSRGAILVFFDVSKLKLLENSRKNFVANVSHELKTPLTSIRGYTETLLESLGSDRELEERFVNKIQQNAIQLQNLIEDLLALSEIESGRQELKTQSILLDKVFKELVQSFQENLENKSIVLQINAEPDLAVKAEPAALKQILSNLIDNAIKYSEDSKKILLNAKTENDQVSLRVKDEGPGIPAEDLPHIFERFYRVDKARSRELGGTGLGLAIVKHLVQTQKGEVGVISELGKGAEFYFTLPKA